MSTCRSSINMKCPQDLKSTWLWRYSLGITSKSGEVSHWVLLIAGFILKASTLSLIKKVSILMATTEQMLSLAKMMCACPKWRAWNHSLWDKLLEMWKRSLFYLETIMWSADLCSTPMMRWQLRPMMLSKSLGFWMTTILSERREQVKASTRVMWSVSHMVG